MNDTCFVITPIGSPDSPQRRRADRLCDQILVPAIEGCVPQLELVRGDRIQESGPITVQLVEYITEARLIVADLVDPSPNVYYELGIAESFQKPVIRFGGADAEALPFDVREMRTLPLPQYPDGRVDVLDAERCIAAVRSMLPAMLADDYKANSIIAMAGRRAALASLTGMIDGDENKHSQILSQLVEEVSWMRGELQRFRARSQTVRQVTPYEASNRSVRVMLTWPSNSGPRFTELGFEASDTFQHVLNTIYTSFLGGTVPGYSYGRSWKLVNQLDGAELEKQGQEDHRPFGALVGGLSAVALDVVLI